MARKTLDKRLYFLHWRSPKIIEEYLRYRAVRSQILVILYCTDIVENEIAFYAVIIT